MSEPKKKSGKTILTVFHCKKCNARVCCMEDGSGIDEVCSVILCSGDSCKCKSDSFEVMDGGNHIICVGCQLKKAKESQSGVKQRW